MTKADKSGLSERQKKAIPFFLGSRSEGDCCSLAQISRQTYYEWLKDPSFRTELSRLRNVVVEDAVETLKFQTSRAIDTLVKLLDVDSPALQRNVANDILHHVVKFKEIQEIEKRLDALETIHTSRPR